MSPVQVIGQGIPQSLSHGGYYHRAGKGDCPDPAPE